MISFKETIRNIRHDLEGDRSNSILLFLTNYFRKPRFRLLYYYRLGKFFFNHGNIVFKQLGISYKNKLIRRNCDISFNSDLGRNIKMPHPIGIVIGDGVIIKDNVTIFQQVTFGSHGRKGKEFEYPVVEKGVRIYPGAKVIGGIIIGENAIIGANAVVNIDVPANSVAVGVPCKILNK